MKTKEPYNKKSVCAYVHKVAAGDTLYKIARRYGVDYGRLMALNGITNPYNLKVGTEICIPPSLSPGGRNCAGFYVIREGDTLYSIARRFGVELDDLMAANSDIDPYNMHIGMRLCIPPRRASDSTTGRPGASGGQSGGTGSASGNNSAGGSGPAGGSVSSGSAWSGPAGGSVSGGSAWSGPAGGSVSGGSGWSGPAGGSVSGGSTLSGPAGGSVSGGSGNTTCPTCISTTPGTQTSASSGAASNPSNPSNRPVRSPSSAESANADEANFDSTFLADEANFDSYVGRSATTARESDDSVLVASDALTSSTGTGSPRTQEGRNNNSTGETSADPVFTVLEAESVQTAADPASSGGYLVRAIENAAAAPVRGLSPGITQGAATGTPYVSDTMPDGILYRVEQGETLTDILKKFGICFSALDYNNSSVDFNEDLTGLTLNIPYGDKFCFTPNNQLYIVRQDDSLDKLSVRFDISTDDLLRLNPMRRPEDFASVGSRVNVTDEV